jgi:hypothetical protein
MAMRGLGRAGLGVRGFKNEMVSFFGIFGGHFWWRFGGGCGAGARLFFDPGVMESAIGNVENDLPGKVAIAAPVIFFNFIAAISRFSFAGETGKMRGNKGN